MSTNVDLSELIEDLGEVNEINELSDENEKIFKSNKDNGMSKVEKAKVTKSQLDNEIENRAERLSNKKGIDMSLARLKVIEKDPDLYAEYKYADQVLQSKTNAELQGGYRN